MKNFLWLFIAISMVSGSMLFTSCSEDDGGGGDPGDILPTVTISGISSTEVDPGDVVTFTVTSDKGTNDMSSLTVTLDGTALDAGTNFTIDEYTNNGITLNNPQILTGNDANNFVYTVNVTMPDASGDYTIEVVVADNKNQTSSDFFTVTVFEPVVISTPLDFDQDGVLFNQAGPAGNGGLDLDTGLSTGSQDADAELRDVGIDCTLTGENWRAEFGTVNGADMVLVDQTVIENFSFDAVDNKEIVENAYLTAGITLNDGVSQAPNCDETPVTDVTDGATVGDVYAIFANGVYYLIRIDEINFVEDDAMTTQNEANLDNYVVSIKY